MYKIFVDPQGNWQPYQSWQDEVVENQPEQFAFYGVDELPDVLSRFIDGEFVAIEVVESGDDVEVASIDPIALWEILADQEEAIIELQSLMEE